LPPCQLQPPWTDAAIRLLCISLHMIIIVIVVIDSSLLVLVSDVVLVPY
jgi:hypothetical protein